MYYLMDALIGGERTYFIVKKINSDTAKIIKVLKYSCRGSYRVMSSVLYFPNELIEEDENIETLEQKYYLSLL